MDVFVGIEGRTIDGKYSIPIDELSCNGKYKLTLNITKHKDSKIEQAPVD